MNLKTKSSAPSRKVAAGGLGGAISVIFLWLIGGDVPPEVAASITLVIVFLLSYLVPESSDTYVDTTGTEK